MNIDEIREATEAELGLCTDNDYALIVDKNKDFWSTETLPKTGEQIKRKLDKVYVMSILNTIFQK